MKTENKTPTELFEEALKHYETAVKAGLKLQQETTETWSRMLKEAGLPEEWYTRFKETTERSLPLVQKNAEETLQLIEANSKSSVEMLKMAMAGLQSKTLEEGQARTKELWEASLQNLRENAKAVVQANARMMENWNGFVRSMASHTGAGV